MRRRRKKKNPSTGAWIAITVGGVVVAGLVVSALVFNSSVKVLAAQVGPAGGTPGTPPGTPPINRAP